MMLDYRVSFFLFTLISFLLLYQVAYIAFGIEDSKSKKLYKKARIYRIKPKNFSYILAPYIILPEYKRLQLQKSIDSLGFKEKLTIEQYYSEVIVKSLPYYFATGAIFFLTGLPQELGVGVLSYSLYTTQKLYMRLPRALQVRRLKIEEEAPSLIRHFLVALKSNFDIEEHFRAYLPFAKYLKTDIEILLTDMATTRHDISNEIYALDRFSERCNTPIITDFIAGLINTSQGRSQETYFMMLEQEIKVLALDNMMRKNQKIDGKIRRVFYILVVNFMFFLFSCIGSYIVTTLTTL